MEREYHYDDIILIPKYSEVVSRKKVNPSVDFGPLNFKLPIVPANMKTVIDQELAVKLAQAGLFYIMHRFGVDLRKLTAWLADQKVFSSISVGVKGEENLEFCFKAPDYITVDIAHGHCEAMQRTLARIKKLFPETFIIAGNVCTADGVKFLADNGADAVKVGIGSGKVCTTKLMTGFSRPQFSALLACRQVAEDYSIHLIADGGIEHNGDIAKALAGGASMAMIGHMMAGFDESPGQKIIHDDGRITKEYFGSASEHNKSSKEFLEGRRIEIPYRGSIYNKIEEINQSLRSSISYAGGHDIWSLRKVDWVVQKS